MSIEEIIRSLENHAELLDQMRRVKGQDDEKGFADTLREAAALLAHPGPVLLSGYDNELYNDTLIGWDKLQHKARSECGGARTETLWINYEPKMTLLGGTYED